MAGTYQGKLVTTYNSVHIPCLASSKIDIDAGLTTEDIANGTRYNEAFVYASQAKGTATIDAPYSGALGALLVTGTPAAHALTFVWPNGGYSFPAAWMGKFKISGAVNKYLMASCDFTNVGAPAAQAGAAASAGAINPPKFKDVVVSFGGASAGLKSFEISFDQGLILDYTNSGDQYPSEVIPGKIAVSGKFSFKKVDNSFVALLVAACQSGAAGSVSVAAVCGAETITLTLAGIYFTKLSTSGSMTAAVMDDIEFRAISTDGGTTIPLTIA